MIAEPRKIYKSPRLTQIDAPNERYPVRMLPAKILKQLRPALDNETIIIAPNTPGFFVSSGSFAEIPPGFIVILVFDPVDRVMLPTEHEDGKIYLLEN